MKFFLSIIMRKNISNLIRTFILVYLIPSAVFSQADQYLNLQLFRDDTLRAETIIYTTQAATDSFDICCDVLILNNPLPNTTFGSYAADRRLTINAIPPLSCPVEISLALTAITGDYVLSATQLTGFNSGQGLLIEDTETSITQDFLAQTDYAFTTNSAQQDNRLIIHLIPDTTSVLNVSISGETEFCTGSSSVLYAVYSTGSIVEFQWMLNGNDIPDATNDSLIVSQAGSYSIRINDLGECTATSLPVNVTVNPNLLPMPTISPVNPSMCPGDSVVLSSTAADSYIWLPGGETTQLITAYMGGIYNVIASDQNGCAQTSENDSVFEFYTPSLIAFVQDGQNPELCMGDGIGIQSNAVDPVTWWPGGETTDYLVVTQAGEYYATDIFSNGCARISNTIIISALGTPVAGFLMSANVINVGDTVEFTNTTTNVNGQTQYMWDFCDGAISTSTGNVSHNYTDTSEYVECICLIATNVNGCADTVCNSLIVDYLTALNITNRTERLNIFPNPGSVHVKIQIPDSMSKYGTIRVINALGVEIMSADLELYNNVNRQFLLDLSMYANGLYFINFFSDHYNLTEGFLLKGK